MPDLTTGDLASEGGLKPIAIASYPKLPKDGLIVVEPHASWIVDGSKTILIKSRPYKISGSDYLLLTRNRALGIIHLSSPKEINLKKFKELEAEHKITPKERQKFWSDKKKFWAYKIVKLRLFASPIPIEPLVGPQVTARDVKLKLEKSPTMFELAKADGDALANFSAWLKRLVALAPSWSKSVLRFLKGPENIIDAIKKFPVFVISMSRSIDVSGGSADKEVGFPKALESAIKWGSKALQAIKETDQTSLVESIKHAVTVFESMERIVDSVMEAEDLEVLNVNKEVE